MIELSNLSTDFYINVHVNTEMAMPTSRETVLGFFERLQKSYPMMQNFYTREPGHCVLEEEKEQGHYRWVSIEPRRICSGYVNPPNSEAALEQHRLVLELIPYLLSVSPLDCEAMDLLCGFDFACRGNHNTVIAEALGVAPAFDGLLSLAGSQPINIDPSLTIALDEACRLQARLLVETRTTAAQVRRCEFGEEVISVFFTTRQYGSLPPGITYVDTMNRLQLQSERLLTEHLIENVLKPLARAISTR